ncbi:hypothetical protein [Pseudomonas aeruginosa]|uniref:hypothetical protein n=1 Tax=Pseudomonas aeruginosa TaxID=287 RepID=UPI001F29EA5F|nr:hypothetical protein [Pseudomonas aeruginosa]
MNTWVSFQSAEQPLLGQFSVSGNTLLPGIQKCLASGYIQRTDLATGSIGDQYVISALISRDQWETLDFSRLEAIDPGATLKAFGAVVSVDRTSRFREITPMDLATLG